LLHPLEKTWKSKKKKPYGRGGGNKEMEDLSIRPQDLSDLSSKSDEERTQCNE
jgi:hypothetical protein